MYDIITLIFAGSLGKTTDLVHLDRDTGEMVVAGRIDHEQSTWLNMSVRATDSGFPNRSSFVDVFIQVVDENDNNPYFIDSTLSNVSVPEDAAVGKLQKSSINGNMISTLNFIIIRSVKIISRLKIHHCRKLQTEF